MGTGHVARNDVGLGAATMIAETEHAMTPEQLTAIKARVEAATPGPWSACTCGKCGQVWFADGELLLLSMNRDARDGGYGTPRPRKEWEADQTFIAHVPEDILTLVAEVERLQSALAQRSTAP